MAWVEIGAASGFGPMQLHEDGTFTIGGNTFGCTVSHCEVGDGVILNATPAGGLFRRGARVHLTFPRAIAQKASVAPGTHSFRHDGKRWFYKAPKSLGHSSSGPSDASAIPLAQPIMGIAVDPPVGRRLLSSGLACWVDPEECPYLFFAEDLYAVCHCVGFSREVLVPEDIPSAARRFFAVAAHYRHNVAEPLPALMNTLFDGKQIAMLNALLAPEHLNHGLQLICRRMGFSPPNVLLRARFTPEAHRSCSVHEDGGVATILIPLGLVVSTWVLFQALVAYDSGWRHDGNRLRPYHFFLMDSVNEVDYRFCASALCLAELTQRTLTDIDLQRVWELTLNATTFQVLHELGHVAARHLPLLSVGARQSGAIEIEADKAAAAAFAEVTCAVALAARDFSRGLLAALVETSSILCAVYSLVDSQFDPAKERSAPRTGRYYPPQAVRFDTAKQQIADTLAQIEAAGEEVTFRDKNGHFQKGHVPKGADLAGAWWHVLPQVWRDVYVALGKLCGTNWGPEPTYLDDEYLGLLGHAELLLEEEGRSLAEFRELVQQDESAMTQNNEEEQADSAST